MTASSLCCKAATPAGCVPATRHHRKEGLLFLKKKQKTLAQLASAFPQRLSLNLSKFFGSFFQKRTAFFAACLR
jgi:hypothetical protein